MPKLVHPYSQAAIHELDVTSLKAALEQTQGQAQRDAAALLEAKEAALARAREDAESMLAGTKQELARSQREVSKGTCNCGETHAGRHQAGLARSQHLQHIATKA